MLKKKIKTMPETWILTTAAPYQGRRCDSTGLEHGPHTKEHTHTRRTRKSRKISEHKTYVLSVRLYNDEWRKFEKNSKWNW